MRASSLAAQLRRRVTAVVAILAVLISAGTIVSAGVILYSQLDVQLDNARTLQFKEPGAQDKRPKGITVPGMPPGTVTVMRLPDDLVLAAKIGYGEYDVVSDEAINTLLQVPTNGQKHTIDIGGSPRAGRRARRAGRIPPKVCDWPLAAAFRGGLFQPPQGA